MNGRGDVAVALRGLVRRYGPTVAVRGLDLEIRRGEIFGFVGPDGAGKTTTFHTIAGMLEPSAGTVRVFGAPPHATRERIGYLTQQFSLYADLTLDENLRYLGKLRAIPTGELEKRRAEYLGLMGLERFGDRLAGRLSGGMKQKLALCCALVGEPELLLLDEPTTGVDPVSRRELWRILAHLARRGITIVVATPYLDEAERCTRVALMYAGEMRDLGTPAELKSRLGLELLEFRPADVALAERELSARAPLAGDPIADVQTYGDRIDVLVHDADSGSRRVREVLGAVDLTPSPPTLENVFIDELRRFAGDAPPAAAFPFRTAPRADVGFAIRAKGLRKNFGEFAAVRDLDLDVRYGEVVGLLGANGAGKTTTIKMLCGLLEPSAGSIEIAGRSRDLRATGLRQRIGYMSQRFTLYDDLTIEQNLDFYAGVYGVGGAEKRAKIEWALESCGLADRRDRLARTLPGGWKQRVAFGASILHEPDILFLDEPTSGVDPLARRELWRAIDERARRGTAVLVTTHYLEEAEHCGNVLFMAAGSVVAHGSPSAIKASVGGTLIEVSGEGILPAFEALEGAFEPWRVALFGDRVHVVVDGAEQRERVRSVAVGAGARPTLREIPFSLEDAFIDVVSRVAR